MTKLGEVLIELLANSDTCTAHGGAFHRPKSYPPNPPTLAISEKSWKYLILTASIRKEVRSL